MDKNLLLFTKDSSMIVFSKDEIAAMSLEVLMRWIKKANAAYAIDAPMMEDETYDLLKVALATRPQTPNVQGLLFQVGEGEKGSLKHSAPMLSLDKAYEDAEVQKWAKNIRGDVAATLKLDGMALAIRYKNGELDLALTRSDTETGEDVTDAVREIASIPKKIPVKRDLEVRGEAFLPFSSFQTILKDIDPTAKNPRNTAAGAIKTQKVTGGRTDFEEAKKKILALIRFEAYSVQNPAIDSYCEILKNLSKAGFLIPNPLVMGLNDAFALWKDLDQNREKYDKPVDGIVLRANSVKEYEDMGYTGHHPKGAIAYKFSAEIKETTLLSVEWSLGRTSKLTPVGIVEKTMFPVSGATVERVTLHNISRMKELGLSLGARIKLTRAGDCIPTVLAVVTPGNQAIVPPDTCPSCKAPTLVKDDFLYCQGDACIGSACRGIEHYCKSVGIDGFGPSIIEQLFTAGLATNFSHLYTKLTVDNMTPVLGEKTARNLLKQIDAAKSVPLSKFLDGLGIANLGTTMGKRLEPILDAKSPKELVMLPDFLEKHGGTVDGLGEVVKRNVKEAMPKMEIILMQLDGIVTLTKEIKKTGVFTGKSFVFTGTMAKFGRSDAQKKVANLGGDTPSSVKKGVTYLVCGGAEAKSDKSKKAEKLGVQILTEDEFLKLIGE